MGRVLVHRYLVTSAHKACECIQNYNTEHALFTNNCLPQYIHIYIYIK